MRVRPATASDALAAAFDLERDRWRDGGNRRSFVAVDDDGALLGHCRAIDNRVHPGVRTLVLETSPDADDAVAIALLDAQLAVSTLPLRCKPTRLDTTLLALARQRAGRVVQLMPPWRYPVSPALRRWAASRSTPGDARIVSIDAADRAAVAALFVEHYARQHASWSPTAEPAVLHEAFADLLLADGPDARDEHRSVALLRDGALVAQAIVDPPADDGSEVVLQALPRGGATARQDLEACLAETIRRSRDGQTLLVDAHLTEADEMALVAGLPSPPAAQAGEWTAIVAIPLPGAEPPAGLAAADVPDDAGWARTLAR
ncbi:hypothetical protein [Agrococcus sp. SGAir0287]|uniref:hypothetical protein n=1 Tax=Agrococcus sp. SGAir0287 TaxID=2070347 RepID=UPI0010CCF314|nr:hypothetical protein [Agrococcus sp. SGAir0287]QCR18763.1 hypothetical protein C1N71_04270 [Agrococcus sp. SGAir0287]